jgi:hypothetical protein
MKLQYISYHKHENILHSHLFAIFPKNITLIKIPDLAILQDPMLKQHVSVKQQALMLHIQEITGFILGPKTG